MRQVKRKKSITIGLIINTAVKSSRDGMYAIANKVQNDSSIRVQIFQGSPATTIDNLREFVAKGFDGLIVCGFRNKLVADFRKSSPNLPPIVRGLYVSLSEEERRISWPSDTIAIDNERIGRDAADFFIRHALQSFAFFGSEANRESCAGKIRADAFFSEIRSKAAATSEVSRLTIGHAEANEDYWTGDHERIAQWLKGLKMPCGVFANSELDAFALLKICQEIGLDVPRKVEILCVDNTTAFCDNASPTISHFKLDFAAAVDIAITILRSRIIDGSARKRVYEDFFMGATLVERASTASGRGFGSVAERVKEYLRVHGCEAIQVPDVARQLGVSRRTIEKHVREATGQSVLDLIRSMRLAEVCRLLESTDMSISDITQKVGYSMTANLSVTFRKAFGMSMRKYREIRKNKAAANGR